jgi:hypothetical protein
VSVCRPPITINHSFRELRVSERERVGGSVYVGAEVCRW